MVLPHQHFLGDSSSLSDSLYITESARIYSSGIYADLKTTHVFSGADTGSDVGITTRTAATVLEGTRGFSGRRRSSGKWEILMSGSPTGKMRQTNHRTN